MHVFALRISTNIVLQLCDTQILENHALHNFPSHLNLYLLTLDGVTGLLEPGSTFETVRTLLWCSSHPHVAVPSLLGPLSGAVSHDPENVKLEEWNTCWRNGSVCNQATGTERAKELQRHGAPTPMSLYPRSLALSVA